MDWGTFSAAFGLVFVAELGDKTQLAVVTQTCKHRRPWAVFAGASAALSIVTALGAVGGQALGYLIPDDLLRIAAALAFVVMGLLIARAAFKDNGSWSEEVCGGDCESPGDDSREGTLNSAWNWHIFGATFYLLFLAELGDKTQLAVLSLSSGNGHLWAILGGGATALTLVTALGVIGGRVLCALVPRRLLLWGSAAAFIIIGVLIGFGTL